MSLLFVTLGAGLAATSFLLGAMVAGGLRQLPSIVRGYARTIAAMVYTGSLVDAVRAASALVMHALLALIFVHHVALGLLILGVGGAAPIYTALAPLARYAALAASAAATISLCLGLARTARLRVKLGVRACSLILDALIAVLGVTAWLGSNLHLPAAIAASLLVVLAAPHVARGLQAQRLSMLAGGVEEEAVGVSSRLA